MISLSATYSSLQTHFLQLHLVHQWLAQPCSLHTSGPSHLNDFRWVLCVHVPERVCEFLSLAQLEMTVFPHPLANRKFSHLRKNCTQQSLWILCWEDSSFPQWFFFLLQKCPRLRADSFWPQLLKKIVKRIMKQRKLLSWRLGQSGLKMRMWRRSLVNSM